MGLFDFLGGSHSFEEPFSQDELSERTDQSRGRFSEILNEFVQRGQNLQDEPRLSARELFGDQMQQLTDSARSTANATKQALSRAMMAGGGDVSGAAAGNLLGVGENLNESISDIGLKFSRLADRINRQRKRRGDQLAGQGLQGIQNLFRSDQGMLSNVINREIQRETASKQRGSGILGGLLNTAGTLGSAAIMACWVAEELYGKDSERVFIIRNFLLSHDGADNEFGRFLEEYRENGRQWAMKVASDPSARMAAEKLFDEIYKVATQPKAA